MMLFRRQNILRNIVTKNNAIPCLSSVLSRNYGSKLTEMVYARNYNILSKEKSDIIEADQWGYYEKILHSIFISGGWVLESDISYNNFKVAIQDSLDVFPWIAGRITNLTDAHMTLYFNNQGIKLNVSCHPELSLNPHDAIKYNNLQNALKPYNRNIFFTEDAPIAIKERKEYEETPLIMIQLNYLNKENIDDDGDGDGDGNGCIVTFKMQHGFADGYTGYYYMKYLSDYLSNNNLNQYNNLKYREIFDINTAINTNLSDIEFERKWGLNGNDDRKEVLPYIVLYKHNFDEIQEVKSRMDEYTSLLSDDMEYFTLKFTKNDIEEIKKKIIGEMSDNDRKQNIQLTTYEAIVSYLTVFVAKYECKDERLNRILFPINLRDRASDYHSNCIGNVVNLLSVGIDENMKYNASSFALKLKDCLNIYARKTKKLDIFDLKNGDNDYWKLFQELSSDVVWMHLKYSYKYNLMEHLKDSLNPSNIVINEFRTMQLYDNYSFGTNKKPIYYMNGTHFTFHRFMLLSSPNDDGVIVSIRMSKSKTKQFRENEKEFFNKYEEKQPLNLHEKNYNYQ